MTRPQCVVKKNLVIIKQAEKERLYGISIWTLPLGVLFNMVRLRRFRRFFHAAKGFKDIFDGRKVVAVFVFHLGAGAIPVRALLQAAVRVIDIALRAHIDAFFQLHRGCMSANALRPLSWNYMARRVGKISQTEHHHTDNYCNHNQLLPEFYLLPPLKQNTNEIIGLRQSRIKGISHLRDLKTRLLHNSPG